MSLFSSSRHFRIWDYHCTHARMLIRSPRDENLPGSETIDLMFTGVSYLNTIPEFDGLEIQEANPDEVKKIESETGQPCSHNFFLLESGGRKNIIGAGFYEVLISSRGRNESSLDADCYTKYEPRPSILPGAKTILCVDSLSFPRNQSEGDESSR